jgi:hypothetical protein
MPLPPQPTDRDRENARIRQEISDRQAAEYSQVLAWAMAAFGPGWLPSHRHFLVDRTEEERVRYTAEKPNIAATVYTVKNAAGHARHFTVDGSKVVEHVRYEAGFGAMLLEPHPTRTIKVGGQSVHPHRYSLCWAPFELYVPKTAEQLAALRAIREERKQERAEKRWAEENPLLKWAGYGKEDMSPEEKGRGQ